MPRELSVIEGEAATFNCSVIGTGVSITWKLDDSTINVSVLWVLINESDLGLLVEHITELVELLVEHITCNSV